MVDRIKKIMDEEGMSPGRFAAEIGIKNSRMSHDLSERNNVSLELVTRILERFRGINPEWLLFGRGEMYKTGEVKVGNREPDLFSVQHAQQDLSLNANKADNLYNNTTDTDFFEPEQLKTEEIKPYFERLGRMRTKLLKCKVENQVISNYVNVTREFIAEVVEKALPQTRNKNYTKFGTVTQPKPASVLVDVRG